MIKHVKGDVCKSDVKGLRILTHIVNSAGKWGSGVVIPIGLKWPNVKKEYIDWYNSTSHPCEFFDRDVPWLLGEVQFIQADNETIVANMLAQKCPGLCETINGKQWFPIRYEALEECMGRVAEFAKKNDATIISPWFGTLRSGGSKDIIKLMIEKIWNDIDVVMYEF